VSGTLRVNAPQVPARHRSVLRAARHVSGGGERGSDADALSATAFATGEPNAPCGRLAVSGDEPSDVAYR